MKDPELWVEVRAVIREDCLTDLINKHLKFDDIVYDDDHYERSFTIKDTNWRRILNYKISAEWLTELMNGNMTF